MAKRNGFQGVPSASILVNDAQAIDNMILELAHELLELSHELPEEEE